MKTDILHIWLLKVKNALVEKYILGFYSIKYRLIRSNVSNRKSFSRMEYEKRWYITLSADILLSTHLRRVTEMALSIIWSSFPKIHTKRS